MSTLSTTTSTQELESLLETSRISQQHRHQIISQHLPHLIRQCLVTPETNSPSNTTTSQANPLLTQIIANLLFDNESLAEQLYWKYPQFLNWSLHVLRNAAENPTQQDPNLTLLLRNIIVLWKNICVLILQRVKTHEHIEKKEEADSIAPPSTNTGGLQENSTLHSPPFINSLQFIQSLAILFHNYESLHPFILSLVDVILEECGIPNQWKLKTSQDSLTQTQWITYFSSALNDSSQDPPEQLLRLACVLALDDSFTTTLWNMFYSVLKRLLKDRILKIDWMALMSHNQPEEEDSADEDDEDDFDAQLHYATLVLSTIDYVLIKAADSTQKASTSEDTHDMDQTIFEDLLSIIRTRSDSSAQYTILPVPELKIKALELICNYMQRHTHLNATFVKQLNLLPILIDFSTVAMKEYNAENSMRALRQVIRVIGFLTLDDGLFEQLVSRDCILNRGSLPNDSDDDTPFTIVSLIGYILSSRKDVLMLRNACIALGNLARSDKNCTQLITEYPDVIATLLSTTRHHLTLTVQIFETGQAERQPDVEYLANCVFVLCNLSKCRHEESIKRLIKMGLLELVEQMLHPKLAYLIQFYAVETLSHLFTTNGTQKTNSFIEASISKEQIKRIALRLIELLQEEQAKKHAKLRFVIIRFLTRIMTQDQEIRDQILDQKPDSLNFAEWKRDIRALQQQSFGASAEAESLKKEMDTLADHVEKLMFVGADV